MTTLTKDEQELRDRIAIEVLKAMISTDPMWFNNIRIHEPIAYRAYKLADAMLKERAK